MGWRRLAEGGCCHFARAHFARGWSPAPPAATCAMISRRMRGSQNFFGGLRKNGQLDAGVAVPDGLGDKGSHRQPRGNDEHDAGSTRSPSGVRPWQRCLRSTIGTPSSCSSWRMRPDRVGCVTLQTFAARVKCFSRAKDESLANTALLAVGGVLHLAHCRCGHGQRWSKLLLI